MGATLLSAMVACSVVNSPDDPTPANQDGDGGATPEGCPEGFEVCSGACSRTSIDPTNCGACGNACADGEVCGLGQCLFECGENLTNCGGSCLDLQTEADNCGACGNACVAGANEEAPTCTDGMCSAPTCTAGFDDCDGLTATGCETEILGDDIHNCGACGLNCVAAANSVSATCTGGVCGTGMCEANFGDCDLDPSNGCESNLLTDSQHCNDCATDCNTFACMGGVCPTVGYSAEFTQGVSGTAQQCTDWTTFRATIPASGITGVALTGTLDLDGIVCNNAFSSQLIGNGIRTGVDVFRSCNGHTWSYCAATDRVMIDVADACSDSCVAQTYTLRPCILNINWGGVNTTTCNAPSQTIALGFF